MRPLTLLISSLAVLALALPAQAQDPEEPEDPCADLATEQVWYHRASAPVATADAALDTYGTFDTTPPAAGLPAAFAGDRGVQLLTGESAPEAGATFEGTFEGCIDTIAVETYLAWPGGPAAMAQFGAHYVRPHLIIDGRTVFRPRPAGYAVTTTADPARPGVYLIRFAFVGLADHLKDMAHAFAPIPEEHEVRLHLLPHSTVLDDAGYLFDAPEYPSGQTFNTPDLNGYTQFLVPEFVPTDGGVTSSAECDAPRGAAPPPVGTGPCPGVRPGALLSTSEGSECSFNFMFTGTDDLGVVHRYIGTAGHCIMTSGQGTGNWAYGKGMEIYDGNDNPVGFVVHAQFVSVKDFALIELRPGVEANPQMCWFGGPTGLDDDLRLGPVELRQFGQGIVTRGIGEARTYVARDLRDPDNLQYHGHTQPGDSGSGMITADGRAIAVVSSIGIPGAADGPEHASRLRPTIEDAEKALGMQLELVTAPLLATGR